MAKIRRQNLPRALYDHLLDRVQQRSISAQQLRLYCVGWTRSPRFPTAGGSSDVPNLWRGRHRPERAGNNSPVISGSFRKVSMAFLPSSSAVCWLVDARMRRQVGMHGASLQVLCQDQSCRWTIGEVINVTVAAPFINNR
jgi:hypothetical protein